MILKTEAVGLTDNVQKLLLILRSCFSIGSLSGSVSNRSTYKRLTESSIENQEVLLRHGDNFRAFTDEANIEDVPFASRLFFRTVQTVLGFWDWLRGKIREANNVVSLFCPVHLEIELECKV